MIPAAKHELNLPVGLLEPGFSPAGQSRTPSDGIAAKARQRASSLAPGGTEIHFEQQHLLFTCRVCLQRKGGVGGEGVFNVESATFTSITRNGPRSRSAQSANRSDVSDLCTITAAMHVRPWHNKSGWSDPSVPPRFFHFPCSRRAERLGPPCFHTSLPLQFTA